MKYGINSQHLLYDDYAPLWQHNKSFTSRYELNAAPSTQSKAYSSNVNISFYATIFSPYCTICMSCIIMHVPSFAVNTLISDQQLILNGIIVVDALCIVFTICIIDKPLALVPGMGDLTACLVHIQQPLKKRQKWYGGWREQPKYYL